MIVTSARSLGTTINFAKNVVSHFEINGKVYTVEQYGNGLIREISGPKGNGRGRLKQGPTWSMVEAVFRLAYPQELLAERKEDAVKDDTTRRIAAFMATLPDHHSDLLADALNQYFEHTDQDCGGDDRIDACLQWLEAVDRNAETEDAYSSQMRKENR